MTTIPQQVQYASMLICLEVFSNKPRPWTKWHISLMVACGGHDCLYQTWLQSILLVALDEMSGNHSLVIYSIFAETFHTKQKIKCGAERNFRKSLGYFLWGSWMSFQSNQYLFFFQSEQKWWWMNVVKTAVIMFYLHSASVRMLAGPL